MCFEDAAVATRLESESPFMHVMGYVTRVTCRDRGMAEWIVKKLRVCIYERKRRCDTLYLIRALIGRRVFHVSPGALGFLPRAVALYCELSAPCVCYNTREREREHASSAFVNN